MTARDIILIVAGLLLAVGILTVLAWFIYTAYLDHVERRLAARKSLYRELVAGLATREQALLEPTINQMSSLYDLDALEAALEEQARNATDRPGWLLEVYDRLGLVDKYIDKLRSARKWRDRAFAAELLGRVGGAKAVPVLLETVNATRSEDSDVRGIALRALARIADPGAVEPLIRALATADVWLAPRIADILARHGEVAVDPLLEVLGSPAGEPARAWAANVLGEIRAQRAFPVLVRTLGDPDDEVRAKSATALGHLGDRRAIGYLLEQLLTDSAPFVRLRIASSLGKFGGPEVVDRLVRALSDQSWWVRMRSVEALEQIGPAAAAPLVVALDDPDSEVRGRAAVALERLGVTDDLVRKIAAGDQIPEASDLLVKFARAGARELLAEIALHPSPQVRDAATTAIHRAGRKDLAAELIRIASGDPEPSLRALAFEALYSLRVSEALPAGLTALHDPDQRVRVAAIRLVAEINGPNVVHELRTQTVDPEGPVRAAAARALGRLGAAAAEPDLLRLLGDPKPAVREAAAFGVVGAGLRPLVPALIELLPDKEESVRHQAAEAVGVLGDRSLAPKLLRAFADASPELREAILLTLSRLDPGVVVEALEMLDPMADVNTKRALIRILRRFRSVDSIPALERLAGDPAPGVRAAAIEVLGRVARASSQALGDPDETVRASAVDACSRAGGEEHGSALLELLRDDPAPVVRERAALAIGLLRPPFGERELLAACRREEPPNVKAAAALAVGAYDRESIAVQVLEMPDQASVRELMRERLKTDSRFRLLAAHLTVAARLELTALNEPTLEQAQVSLAEGLRGMLDAGERVRLLSILRAFQGEQSRQALLEIVRSEPNPEVRTAALAAVADLLDEEELLAVGARTLADPSPLVRRAAVALFGEVSAERAMAKLIQVLRVEDDPAVLAAAAGLAEDRFAFFSQVALALPLDSDRAVLVVRISRHIHHPDLSVMLPVFALSGSPEVRGAVAELWRFRPDTSNPMSLEALTVDPVVAVRLSAVWAVQASERYDLLDRVRQDPDPTVRREIAVVLGRRAPVKEPGQAILERLAADPDISVRAAAYVARLLQGTPLPLPPGLDGQTAAQAVLDIGDLPNLRLTARTAIGEDQRLAAALTLALLQDDVAREVARTDPVPGIRHRVGGALELSIVSAA